MMRKGAVSRVCHQPRWHSDTAWRAVSALPILPFKVYVFLADTTHIMAEQIGYYLRLLLATWQQGNAERTVRARPLWVELGPGVMSAESRTSPTQVSKGATSQHGAIYSIKIFSRT